jgi:hypothetical protein
MAALSEKSADPATSFGVITQFETKDRRINGAARPENDNPRNNPKNSWRSPVGAPVP